MNTTANNNRNITAADIALAECKSEFKTLNECAKRYTERNVPYYGTGCIYPTKVLEEIAKYGAENIFEYVEDYHGKYEDDYCTFVYINNITGESFSDHWTTAGACPNFGLYECVTLQKAVQAGLPINPAIYESFRKVVRGEAIGLLHMYENPLDLYHETTPQVGRLVTINRGRKWQGTGYLMEIKHNTYHPAGRWSPVKTHTAVVFDPTTNTIHEANADYAVYADQEQFKAEFEAWVDAKLEGTTIEDVMPSFHSFNYNMVSKLHPCVFYREYIERHPMPSTEGASYPVQDEKVAKYEAYKASQMPKLIEWCRSKAPEKTEEELVAWANKIFTHNHPMR